MIFGAPSETRKHLERTFIYLGFSVLCLEQFIVDDESPSTPVQPPDLVVFVHSLSSESMENPAITRYPYSRFIFIGAQRPPEVAPSSHMEYLSTPLKMQSLSQAIRRLMSADVKQFQGTSKETPLKKKPKPIPRIAQVSDGYPLVAF